MKRLLTLLAILAFGQAGFASHTSGAQVYWDALGNNQYKFYFSNLTPCGTTLMWSPQITTDAPIGSITLTQQPGYTSTDICVSCGTTFDYEVATFESAIVTIQPPAPGNHWTFTFEFSGMPVIFYNNVPNTHFDVVMNFIMTREGANRNSVRFNLESLLSATAEGVHYLEPIAYEGDSVYVDMAELDSAAGTPYRYYSGYSYMHPTGPQDVIRHNSAVFIADTVASSNMSSLLAFEASAYNNQGALTSSIEFWFIGAYTQMQNHSNHDPVAQVYTDATWNVIDGSLYRRKVYNGEHIQIPISVVDNDLVGGSPQNIRASIVTESVGNYNVLKPRIAPGFGQNGLTSAGTNDVMFEWFVPATLPRGTYRFYVRFEDDDCDNHGAVTIPFDMVYEGIWGGNFSVCMGSSTTLNAPYAGNNYQWWPSTGLSSTSSATVQASPTQNTTYYLAIDGDTVGEYNFDVRLPAPVIENYDSTAATWSVLNSKAFEEHVLLYFGLPIASNDTIFSLPFPGQYQIACRNGNCYTYSPIVWHQMNPFRATSATGGSHVNPEVRMTLRGGDQSRVSYDITGKQNGDVMILDEIQLPDVLVSGSYSNVQLVIDSTGSPMQTLSASSFTNGILQFNLNSPITLTSSMTLTLSTSGQTMLSVPFKEYDPNDATFAIGDVSNAPYAWIDSTVHRDLLVPYVFKGSVVVSLDEDQPDWSVHPIPANDVIIIESSEELGDYTITDMNGRVCVLGNLVSGREISVSDLPNGMYILSVNANEGPTYRRIVVRH